MRPWFDARLPRIDLSRMEIAKRHKEAYEQSLTSSVPIQVHSGRLYYRGYEIAQDKYEYPEEKTEWTFRNPALEEIFQAESKEDAIIKIDQILKEE